MQIASSLGAPVLSSACPGSERSDSAEPCFEVLCLVEGAGKLSLLLSGTANRNETCLVLRTCEPAMFAFSAA